MNKAGQKPKQGARPETRTATFHGISPRGAWLPRRPKDGGDPFLTLLPLRVVVVIIEPNSFSPLAPCPCPAVPRPTRWGLVTQTGMFAMWRGVHSACSCCLFGHAPTPELAPRSCFIDRSGNELCPSHSTERAELRKRRQRHHYRRAAVHLLIRCSTTLLRAPDRAAGLRAETTLNSDRN
jgi:hypothetical protein